MYLVVVSGAANRGLGQRGVTESEMHEGRVNAHTTNLC